MRKVINIILLFCLVIYIGGYHLVYIFYQQGLKTEMRAYLKENHQSKFGTRIIFSTNKGKVLDPDFAWEEENEEFRYKQILYDIISIEEKDGSIELVCLKDNNENQLERQLNEIHQSNKTNTSKSIQGTFKIFSAFYFQSCNLFNFSEQIIIRHSHYYSSSILKQILETLQPPPDVKMIS